MYFRRRCKPRTRLSDCRCDDHQHRRGSGFNFCKLGRHQKGPRVPLRTAPITTDHILPCVRVMISSIGSPAFITSSALHARSLSICWPRLSESKTESSARLFRYSKHGSFGLAPFGNEPQNAWRSRPDLTHRYKLILMINDLYRREFREDAGIAQYLQPNIQSGAAINAARCLDKIIYHLALLKSYLGVSEPRARGQTNFTGERASIKTSQGPRTFTSLVGLSQRQVLIRSIFFGGFTLSSLGGLSLLGCLSWQGERA